MSRLRAGRWFCSLAPGFDFPVSDSLHNNELTTSFLASSIGSTRNSPIVLLRLKNLTLAVTRELRFYRAVLRDPRTPRISKLCLAAALGYLALPFDLIPDFLPGIGHLDDVLIVGGLVWIALTFIPNDVLEDSRLASTDRSDSA